MSSADHDVHLERVLRALQALVESVMATERVRHVVTGPDPVGDPVLVYRTAARAADGAELHLRLLLLALVLAIEALDLPALRVPQRRTGVGERIGTRLADELGAGTR